MFSYCSLSSNARFGGEKGKESLATEELLSRRIAKNGGSDGRQRAEIGARTLVSFNVRSGEAFEKSCAFGPRAVQRREHRAPCANYHAFNFVRVRAIRARESVRFGFLFRRVRGMAFDERRGFGLFALIAKHAGQILHRF
jgi:hypothetical protein